MAFPKTDTEKSRKQYGLTRNTMCDMFATGGIVRIFKTSWFTRFAEVQSISDEALRHAVEKIETGRADADLGGSVFKQRIARPGQGTSKGYRTIVLLRKGYRAFFVYGFAKSDRANTRPDEDAQFKKMAEYVLGLSDDQLATLIAQGRFQEVHDDDQEISK